MVNPYDPCVANKMVDGAQMYVCWHVDYLTPPHRDEDMVTAFAVDMANIYGEKTTISIGRVHGYLLMELDLEMCPGTLIIYMIKYLQKIIDNFPEVLRGTKACPAGDNIFNIRDNKYKELLPEEMARQFHRTTATLLFLRKRARPDVETLISFLTTMVKYPDLDDWGKLRHGLM